MSNFFQDVSTPTKRKQTLSAAASSVSLTPLKKKRTDSTAEDSPRRSGLRITPETPVQTCAVRMSPRKTVQPPSTPSRGPTRAGTPRRGSNARQAKEDGAQVKEKEEPTVKSCSKTRVM